MNERFAGIGCAVAWTTAVALMVVGTVAHVDAAVGWGIFSSLVAFIFTGWLIAISVSARHDRRMDDLERILMTLAREVGGDVPQRPTSLR